MWFELRKTNADGDEVLLVGPNGSMTLELEQDDEITLWVVQDSGEITQILVDEAIMQIVQLRDH